MERRRAIPAAVAASVVAVLVFFMLRHRDATPIDLPREGTERGPTQPVDIYATSGKDKRLTGEGGDAPLPPGHPAIDVPRDDPHANARPPEAGRAGGTGIPVTYVAPESWTSTPPSNAMRLAQWSFVGGGEVTLTQAGGGVESNLDRWAKQMGKESASGFTKRVDVNGLPVTRIDVSGTYSGMAGSGAAQPDWRLFGAVVETDSGLLFVKAVGPAAVLDREAPAFDSFVGSFRAK